MKTIYKYPLTEKVQKIEMPKGAEVLTVGEQFGDSFLWALVDTEAVKVERTFHIFGTGEKIEINVGKYHFIGTFILSGGSYVYHVFELGKW